MERSRSDAGCAGADSRRRRPLAGLEDPVHGPEDYTRCIEAVVRALPGVRLETPEHAISGPHTFIRWVMHATGNNGPFTLTGIDRVALRDGLIAENIIVFDTAAFEKRAGMPVPWV